MSVKNLPVYKLFLGFAWLLCSTSLYAQGVFPSVVERKTDQLVREKTRDAREAATEAIKEKIGDAKQDAKTAARDLKRNFPEHAKNRLKQHNAYNPYLDELITDPERRNAIESRKNKGRYVNLFEEWWYLPSEAQLKLLDSLRRLREQQANIDSMAYMFPKLVKGTQLPVMIFGWHAAWYGGYYAAYNYDRLTAVAYYAYDVNPLNGDMQNPDDMLGFAPFVEAVHKKERYALLSVSIKGEDNAARFFQPLNQPARRALMDSIVNLLDSTKADGVEFHFMDLSLSEQEEYEKFIKDFSTTLWAIQRDSGLMTERYRIMLSVPAHDPFGVYNLRNLRDYFDYAVVLGFDFQNSPESMLSGNFKKIPVAPLNYSIGDPTYDLRNCVDRYLNDLGRFQSYRMILAIPYFGTLWQQQGAFPEYLTPMPYNQIRYEFTEDTLLGTRIRIDSARTTMIWEWIDTTDQWQGIQPTERFVLYDDIWTLRKKYRFINDTRLGGVGIWFLGDGIGFPELDTLLNQEFMEFIPPIDDKMAKVNAGTNILRLIAPWLLAVLLYWGIFMGAGFCLSLLDRPTRQMLFMKPRFRFFYLTFFTVLILVIGGNLGLFEGPALALTLGVVFGTTIAWLALKFLRDREAAQP